MDGRAAPTFRRVFRTSQGITSAVAGRSAALDCVAGDSDLVGKRPTAGIVADREE
jgi:hypothetical protein